jgi:small neutral amino acid transporter SnatA (MarC family)
MLEEYQEEQRKKVARMRSLMDFVMGALIALIGLYFLLYEKLGINVFNRQPSAIDKVIGGVFIVYGAWRMYRGYKKDYYR